VSERDVANRAVELAGGVAVGRRQPHLTATPAHHPAGGCEDAPRPMSRSPQAKADYGVDDPRVPIVLALSGTASVAIAAVSWAFEFVPGIVVFGLAGLSGVVGAAGYMYATLRGKHRAWARILDTAGLRGDERVLDIGCGRGAVLVAAA